MANLSLWQLDSDYVNIMEQLEINGGELTPELESRLDNVIADIVKKQDGYIKVVDTLDVLEDQAKHWRDRMNQKIIMIQRQRERLKTALIIHLNRLGKTCLKSDLGKIRLMKRQKVGRIDQDKLPAKYKRIIQDIKIDKKSLLADLKKGPVNGADLQESEYIRIF